MLDAWGPDERRLLKEREKEDHLYGDKDKFVTAAYRAKLEEDAKWIKEEKLREAGEWWWWRAERACTRRLTPRTVPWGDLKASSRRGGFQR